VAEHGDDGADRQVGHDHCGMPVSGGVQARCSPTSGPEVAEGILADGLPIFAASGTRSGRAVRVEGGYRFSGSYF
jgi:hypothetical protein